MRSNRSKQKRKNEDQYFQVEAILDERRENNQLSFKVRWVGYPSSADTWEPEEHLSGVRDLIKKFYANRCSSSLQLGTPKKMHTETFDELSPSKSLSLCKPRITKSRSGYYEYVPQNQLTASKTQFFSDIKEGKVDLNCDLYSRVKNRRRHHLDESISPPLSLSEMSDCKINATITSPARHSEPSSPRNFVPIAGSSLDCAKRMASNSSVSQCTPPSENHMIKADYYSFLKPALKRLSSFLDSPSSTTKRPANDDLEDFNLGSSHHQQGRLSELNETDASGTLRQSPVTDEKIKVQSDETDEPKSSPPSVPSAQKLMSVYRNLHCRLSWEDENEIVLSQLPAVKPYADHASIRSLEDLIFAINNHHWTLLATQPIEKILIAAYSGIQHPLVAALIGGEGQPFLLRRLLQADYGSDFVDPVSKWPLLVIAVFYGRIQAVQVLLELGANPNLSILVDGRERTALGVAIAVGNVDMVSLLILGGANLYKVDGDMTSMQFIDELIKAVTLKIPHEASVKLPIKYGIDKDAARHQYVALASDPSYVPPIEAPDGIYLPRSPYITALASSSSSTPISTTVQMSFDGQMSKPPPPDSLQCIHRLISSFHARLFVEVDKIISQWLHKIGMTTMSIVEKGQWLCTHNDSFTVTFPSPTDDDLSSVFVLFLVHGTITPPGCYYLWLGDDGPCLVERVLLGNVEQKPLDRLMFVSTLLPLNRSEENQSILIFLTPKRQKGICIVPLILRLKPVMKNITETVSDEQRRCRGSFA